MSERLYTLLLRLYPARFRKEFGNEAVQLFRDRLRDERGFFLRLRLWLDLLADIGSSLPREYRRVPAAFVSAPVKPLAGFPSFPVLETEPLGPGPFLLGTVLALFALGVFGFLLSHGGNSTTLRTASSQASLSSDVRPAVSRRSATGATATAASRPSQASGATSESTGSVVVPLPQKLRLDGAERRRAIDAVIAELMEHYADRDAAQKIADLLRTHERNGDYEMVSSGTAFAELLTKQMQSVTRDTTLRVVYNGDQNPAGTSQQIDARFSIYIQEARTINSPRN
jgi:hypothetical protein